METDQVADINRRLKAIEDIIWPPGGPGGPTIFEEKIKDLEEKIKSLEGRHVTKDVIEDLIDVVTMLRVGQSRPAAGRFMTMEM